MYSMFFEIFQCDIGIGFKIDFGLVYSKYRSGIQTYIKLFYIDCYQLKFLPAVTGISLVLPQVIPPW